MSHTEALHALVVFGTRPEAIKQAPVIWALRRRPERIRVTALSTGQHREMLRPMLELLDVAPDVELDLMRPDQTLADVTARCVTSVEEVLRALRPDVVVVQGDTTTAMAAALAAFYQHIPVAHVEAGLRSGSMDEPFPEEANRRVVDLFARWLFAPTEEAAALLANEGVDPARVLVTGNTVVDALLYVREKLSGRNIAIEGVPAAALRGERRLVLVTGHRRESFGDGIASICDALAILASRHGDADFVYPVHLNPNVVGPVTERLGGIDNVHLIPPQPYDRFLALLSRAHLVLTDSGGVQEEAPSFDVPVLVMRNRTERPEGVAAGCARLVGTEAGRIVEAADELLCDPSVHARMASAQSPYGDGRAGERIARALAGAPAEEARLAA
ncbi:MAG TPA: UDP-N-acetylglucosamine 2-epimerase (non-hydrolyzing) [Sandaracinaceae bacterium]